MYEENIEVEEPDFQTTLKYYRVDPSICTVKHVSEKHRKLAILESPISILVCNNVLLIPVIRRLFKDNKIFKIIRIGKELTIESE